MMKWFRKHNKQLLAVFASALLVVWLGGQAFQNILKPDPRQATVGTAYGHKLSAVEFSGVRRRLELLQSIGIMWQVPWRNPWVLSQLTLPDQRMQQDPILMAGARPLTDSKGPLEWWLLEQEAQRMGVTISQDEVQRFIAQFNISGDRLTQIRDQMNVSTDEIFGAIGEYLRVSYAAVLAGAGVQVTDPEVKDIFVQTSDQVSLRYALLPYEAFQPKEAASQPVSDAELQDLFNQYKDNLPGAGKYGFGYKIPDRVSVQYVGATVDDVAKTLLPVGEDRARKYFEAHKDKFQPAQPPTTQPTTQPAVKFDEVKNQVIETIRQEDAASLLRSVMEEIRASAFSEFTGSKVDLEAGKVPDSLKNVLEERRNDFATSRKLPLVYRQTGLITQDEAGKEAGIGSASSPGSQGQAIRFADYAFNVEKTAAKPDQPQAEEPMVSKIKTYQPMPVRDEMSGKLRGMYVFRVVGFEDAHAPASLAEVKDKVEHDARVLRAYKQADEAAQKLLAAAKAEGLKAAFAAQFPALATRLATTQPSASRPATPEVELFEKDAITQASQAPAFFIYYTGSLTFPTRLLGIQDADSLLKATFEMADRGPSSQPAAGPSANRVSLVELPAQKAYVVVEVTSHKPANAPDFTKAKPTLVALLRVQKLRSFYAAWYNPDQIEKRAGWQGRQGPM